MVFVHNLNPVLLDLGPVEIRYYGLVYVLGFLLAYLYLDFVIKRKHLRLNKEELYDLIFYNMVGVLVGSRLIHVIFWQPSYYLMRPWEILYIWQGGMAFHGGLLGVALGTYLFWRQPAIRKKVSLLKLGDYLSIPAVFILAVGRLANFLNGELPGRVTDVSWCWYFPEYGGCRHPQQLYSAAKRFLVFGFLVFLHRKKRKDGFIFWNMITLMGVGRFVIDFYREDLTWLMLTAGQWLSAVMVLLGGYVLFRYYRKDLKRVFR
ncbi:prolipoprotein diacylglyceryl transferase [Nanoarchaeota archaeon]